MVKYLEILEDANKYARYSFRCKDCEYYKQESKEQCVMFKDIPVIFYYHICTIKREETWYDNNTCKDFEPTEENKLKYKVEVQEYLLADIFDYFNKKI